MAERLAETEKYTVETVWYGVRFIDGRDGGARRLLAHQARLRDRFESIERWPTGELTIALHTIAALRITPKEELEQALRGRRWARGLRHIMRRPYQDALALEAHWQMASFEVEDAVVKALKRRLGKEVTDADGHYVDDGRVPVDAQREEAHATSSHMLRSLFDDVQPPIEVPPIDMATLGASRQRWRDAVRSVTMR